MFYFHSPGMPSLKPESKLSNDNAIPYNTVEPVYIFQQPLENMLFLRAVSGCDTAASTFRFGIYVVNLWH